MLLFDNYLLTVAVYSWCVAQALKTILNTISNKKFDAERLVGAGGMPSSHSATVTSMVVASAKMFGLSSFEFAMCFMFACVVIYDALGVRRSAGMHAKVINRMVDTVQFKEDEEPKNDSLFAKDLKEYIGHTPLEVIAGSLIGISMAMLIPIK